MITTTNTPDVALPRPVENDRSGHVPCFDSRELFGHGKSVHIEHEGKMYELRVTRLGKLILTA